MWSQYNNEFYLMHKIVGIGVESKINQFLDSEELTLDTSCNHSFNRIIQKHELMFFFIYRSIYNFIIIIIIIIIFTMRLKCFTSICVVFSCNKIF